VTAPRARLRVWDEDACGRVHDATCRVLAETGVEVRHPRALELLRQAGAGVCDTRARLPQQGECRGVAHLDTGLGEHRASRLVDPVAGRLVPHAQLGARLRRRCSGPTGA